MKEWILSLHQFQRDLIIKSFDKDLSYLLLAFLNSCNRCRNFLSTPWTGIYHGTTKTKEFKLVFLSDNWASLKLLPKCNTCTAEDSAFFSLLTTFPYHIMLHFFLFLCSHKYVNEFIEFPSYCTEPQPQNRFSMWVIHTVSSLRRGKV